MRPLLFRLLIPLFCAITFAFFLWRSKPCITGNHHDSTTVTNASDLRYIAAYHGHPDLEDQLLAQPGDSTTIYLLGSSELTSGGVSLPYHFISDRYPVKVMGIGHEGNQCFSIFCQLLAYSERLENAPVVIILSPGWFEDKSSRGTSSAVLLEYLSDRLLVRIEKQQTPEHFRQYAYAGLSHLSTEFSSPTAAFRLANTRHIASRTPVHSACLAPLNTWNAHLQQIDAPAKKEVDPTPLIQVFNTASASPAINWDSLESALIEKHRTASGNNGMGIEAGYYKQYINGKRARIRPVPFSNNREWRDFLELIRLLKENKTNASFIISPLHAGYYTNLRDLQPVIDSLRSEIDRSGYPCLNLFESDSTQYRKHLLSDVMHFSEAGWMQVNRFIIQQYGLHRNEN